MCDSDERLTPYQGKRCFGEFKCEECGRSWFSAFSWANKGQECAECLIMVYPHTQRALMRGQKKKNNKPHREDLCEKCQELGRPCWKCE